MLSKMACIKKVVATTLMVTLASFSSLLTTSALAQVAPKLAGELSSRGTVILNGISATNGATVFNGSSIKTAGKSTATLNLGRMGQIELSPDSELVLNLDKGIIGGELRTGRAVISAPAGVGVNVMTAEGLAVADGKETTLMTVDVACGNTRVSSARSEAKVTAGNRVEIVAAGQEVAVGTQASGDTSRCPRMAAAAAKVSPAISGGALAALILLGVGGAVGGIIAATQGDETNQGVVSGLSTFRP